MQIDKKKIEIFFGLVILLVIAGVITWFYSPKIKYGPPVDVIPSGEMTIIFASDNGSLPPPYYQQNIITLTQDQFSNYTFRSEVRNYDGELGSQDYSLSKSVFSMILAEAQKISESESDLNGCTGGSSQALNIQTQSRDLKTVFGYTCGGKSSNQSLIDFGAKLSELEKTLSPIDTNASQYPVQPIPPTPPNK